MKIDLTTVLNKRVAELDIDYHFDAEKVEGGALLPYGVSLTSPVHVLGKITDKNNCMFIKAQVFVDYTAPCDRCLKEISETLSFDFERMISSDIPSVSNEDDFDSDIIYVSESGIDIDISVTEELVLELPLYRLCKDDCKGLCSKCGKNLNEGACSCSDEKEIDPRLKKLQKLLDNFD